MADGRHPLGVRRTALATVNDDLSPGAKQGSGHRYRRRLSPVSGTPFSSTRCLPTGQARGLVDRVAATGKNLTADLRVTP
jgi:hypothetical protein